MTPADLYLLLFAGLLAIGGITLACLPDAYHFIRYGTEGTPR